MSEGWDKQIAIMREIQFGYDLKWDAVSLRFEAWLTKGGCARLELRGEEALKFIKDYKAYSIQGLDGRPVWVEVEPIGGSPLVKVLEPCLV